MQLPLVAMVLREASALMRISSYCYYPAHAQKRDRHIYLLPSALAQGS